MNLNQNRAEQFFTNALVSLFWSSPNSDEHVEFNRLIEVALAEPDEAEFALDAMRIVLSVWVSKELRREVLLSDFDTFEHFAEDSIFNISEKRLGV